MSEQEHISASLAKQRRFLLLMSLAVIAFYALEIGVKDQAEYSGFVLAVGRPGRVVIGLWVVWAWALWRYLQKVYERLSVVWNDILEDVRAEDLRIALARARKEGRKQAKVGEFDSIPKSARVTIRNRVQIDSPTGDDLQQGPGEAPLTSFRDYVSTRDGGRNYPTLKATFDWRADEKSGSVEERFKMELTRAQSWWIRIRAWIHSILRLPAFADHIAPLLVAGAAVVSPFVRL